MSIKVDYRRLMDDFQRRQNEDQDRINSYVPSCLKVKRFQAFKENA